MTAVLGGHGLIDQTFRDEATAERRFKCYLIFVIWQCLLAGLHHLAYHLGLASRPRARLRLFKDVQVVRKPPL